MNRKCSLLLFALPLMAFTACSPESAPLPLATPEAPALAAPAEVTPVAPEAAPEVEASTEAVRCGAFTPARALSDEERAFFAGAVAGTPAEGLTPEAVATQVVAGMNYDFTCRDGQGRRCNVRIFAPLLCAGDKLEVADPVWEPAGEAVPSE